MLENQRYKFKNEMLGRLPPVVNPNVVSFNKTTQFIETSPSDNNFVKFDAPKPLSTMTQPMLMQAMPDVANHMKF